MAEKFVLRSTVTSPFGRKVRMAIEVLGLSDRVTLVPVNPNDKTDPLRQQNPLGKMPCLLLEDGSTIFDSRVIIEFLQEVAGSTKLLPAGGLARYKALTQAALADGLMDAAILVVYEARYREPGTYSERFLKLQRGKITRALAAFEAAPPDPSKTDIVTIGLSCALAYLDRRKQVDWRPGHGKLVAWLDAFSQREASFNSTFATFADEKT
jgi:glutathione S-transferase